MSDLSLAESAVQEARQAEAAARAELSLHDLARHDHTATCPANPARLTGLRPCTCGAIDIASESLDAYAEAVRATVRLEEAARYEALRPVLVRAQGIIDHGAEMVGPEPYEFTKDEVIEVAYEAIGAALASLEASS